MTMSICSFGLERFCTYRICLPPELYDRFLNDLHEAHQGIEKMQLKARATIYWPA